MPDITNAPHAPAARPPQNSERPNPAQQLIERDPFKTPCTCGTSFVVVAMPFLHCPNCHDTYRCHKLTPPSRCAHCDFNLMAWRKRNNFTFNAPAFP